MDCHSAWVAASSPATTKNFISSRRRLHRPAPRSGRRDKQIPPRDACASELRPKLSRNGLPDGREAERRRRIREPNQCGALSCQLGFSCTLWGNLPSPRAPSSRPHQDPRNTGHRDLRKLAPRDHHMPGRQGHYTPARPAPNTSARPAPRSLDRRGRCRHGRRAQSSSGLRGRRRLDRPDHYRQDLRDPRSRDRRGRRNPCNCKHPRSWPNCCCRPTGKQLPI
jgi:hypothetical protein